MDSTTIARDQLRSIVERVERLHEEREALSNDVRDVYAEAKASGFDTKTIKRVVAIRKQDASERAEADSLLDLYLNALGMAHDPDQPREQRGSTASAGGDRATA